METLATSTLLQKKMLKQSDKQMQSKAKRAGAVTKWQ